MITKKGRYGGTIFELKGFKGLVEYERENKGGRPSLDWTNELLVIRELINQEVALGQLLKIVMLKITSLEVSHPLKF